MDDLLDRAPCGFVSFTDDARIVAINSTLLERLGYERDDVLGRHVETILMLGTRIFFQTHFFPLVRLHGQAREVFLLLRTKSGGDVGMLCNAMRRERDGVAATDCVLLEVIERRKYEDALLEAKRAADRANRQLEEQAVELEIQQQQLQEQAHGLEQQADSLARMNETLTERTRELERLRALADDANRAKSEFLANMSHELRTPLNAIGGYLQLLQMGVHGPVSSAQLDVLGRIDRSQRHLLRLINDVLNLSRIEARRVHYDIGSVPLAEVATHVLPMIEPQIAARGLACTVQVAPDAVALADRDKVQQILLNLLTNAAKFTGTGGTIRVDGGADPEQPGFVVVRVADSGVGIPADMLDRVFEPFVQVDSSHTRTTEGTGLGLAISRDLARGMGGDIRLASTVGVGSTFTLRFPAVG